MTYANKQFQKGFVEHCFRVGLHEKQAAVLLKACLENKMKKEAEAKKKQQR